MIGPKTELTLRAVHATRFHTTKLALLDLYVTWENRTDRRRHDLVALIEVLGTADDLQRNGATALVHVVWPHVDETHPHVVRVGMRLLAHDLGRVHVIEIGTDLLDGLDLGTGANVLRHEVLWVLGHVDHGLEPLIRNAHCASAFLEARLGRGELRLGACPRTGSGNACLPS